MEAQDLGKLLENLIYTKCWPRPDRTHPSLHAEAEDSFARVSEDRAMTTYGRVRIAHTTQISKAMVAASSSVATVAFLGPSRTTMESYHLDRLAVVDDAIRIASSNGSNHQAGAVELRWSITDLGTVFGMTGASLSSSIGDRRVSVAGSSFGVRRSIGPRRSGRASSSCTITSSSVMVVVTVEASIGAGPPPPAGFSMLRVKVSPLPSSKIVLSCLDD